MTATGARVVLGTLPLSVDLQWYWLAHSGEACRLPPSSQKFYTRLGHDVADELIDWFNKVDTTYHADLRELNELNFVRFDAELEQRIAVLRSEVRRQLSQLETRLIRWMFLFWVGTVGTMIALSRFWS